MTKQIPLRHLLEIRKQLTIQVEARALTRSMMEITHKSLEEVSYEKLLNYCESLIKDYE